MACRTIDTSLNTFELLVGVLILFNLKAETSGKHLKCIKIIIKYASTLIKYSLQEIIKSNHKVKSEENVSVQSHDGAANMMGPKSVTARRIQEA